MSKHTPGPWQKNGIVIVGADGAEVCLMGEPAQYAGDIGKMCPNTDANARLIAAAPDLLAALKRLVAWQEPTELLAPHLDGLLRSMYAAKDAIAKAEGRS